MRPPTLPELIADLARAFPRFVRSTDPREAEQQARLYMRELSDLPLDELGAAVRQLVREIEDPWGPSVALIRRTVAERRAMLPDEGQALAQVEARMAWARGREGDAPEVHTLVREALDLVGGYPALKNAERPEVVRGQFMKVYREARARAVREVQLGRPELEPGPTRREIGP